MLTACHSPARPTGLIIKSTPHTLASWIGGGDAMSASLHLLSTSTQCSPAILVVFPVMGGVNLDFCFSRSQEEALSGRFQALSSLSLYNSFGLLLKPYPFPEDFAEDTRCFYPHFLRSSSSRSVSVCLSFLRCWPRIQNSAWHSSWCLHIYWLKWKLSNAAHMLYGIKIAQRQGALLRPFWWVLIVLLPHT